MKGTIWYYEDKIKAKKKFDNLIQKYKSIGIEPVRKIESHNSEYVIFPNEDRWDIRKGSDSARGIRANISYVPADMPIEIIHTIIKPVTIALPYNGIIYY